MARHFLLTADGGSRGNPGPAGYGSVITENGKIIAELYDFIGVATIFSCRSGAKFQVFSKRTTRVIVAKTVIVEPVTKRHQGHSALMTKND